MEPLSNWLPIQNFGLRSDGYGLDCTKDGLTLGGLPLLDLRTNPYGRRGFTPRPEGEIAILLRHAYGWQFDAERRMSGLKVVAASLSDGNVVKAIIAALHLALPDLDDVARERLRAGERLNKFDFDPVPWRSETRRRRDAALDKYSPDQPRVPAGSSEGGQWTGEGEGGGTGGDASGGAGGNAGGGGAGGDTPLLIPVGGILPPWIPNVLDLFGLSPNSPDGIDQYVPDNRLPSNTREILQDRELLPNGNMVVGIPPGYIPTPSRDGSGVVYRMPGTASDDNRNTIRIMPPDARYPTGRVIVYNDKGQPISPYSGRTGSKDQHHYPYGGTVPAPRI
jgi:hypothetical protein